MDLKAFMQTLCLLRRVGSQPHRVIARPFAPPTRLFLALAYLAQVCQPLPPLHHRLLRRRL